MPRPTRITSTPRERLDDLARFGAGNPSARPAYVAVLPSMVIAHLAITHGRPVAEQLRDTAHSVAALGFHQPQLDLDSSGSQLSQPPPATCGKGSRWATTTRRIPAAMIALVQGGVFP